MASFIGASVASCSRPDASGTFMVGDGCRVAIAFRHQPGEPGLGDIAPHLHLCPNHPPGDPPTPPASPLIPPAKGRSQPRGRRLSHPHRTGRADTQAGHAAPWTMAESKHPGGVGAGKRPPSSGMRPEPASALRGTRDPPTTCPRRHPATAPRTPTHAPSVDTARPCRTRHPTHRQPDDAAPLPRRRRPRAKGSPNRTTHHTTHATPLVSTAPHPAHPRPRTHHPTRVLQCCP